MALPREGRFEAQGTTDRPYRSGGIETGRRGVPTGLPAGPLGGCRALDPDTCGQPSQNQTRRSCVGGTDCKSHYASYIEKLALSGVNVGKRGDSSQVRVPVQAAPAGTWSPYP